MDVESIADGYDDVVDEHDMMATSPTYPPYVQDLVCRAATELRTLRAIVRRGADLWDWRYTERPGGERLWEWEKEDRFGDAWVEPMTADEAAYYDSLSIP